MVERSVVHCARAAKTIPDEFRGDAATILATWPRWSQAVRTANLLFASGTGGTDATGAPQHVDDVEKQVALALTRLVWTIEAGGGTLADVVKVRVFVDRPTGVDGALQALEGFFAEVPGRRPALAVVVTSTSQRTLHAEVEAWAATEHESTTCPDVFPGLRPGAPQPDWAHATRVGNLWFSAGLLATAPDGSVSGGPAEQTTRAYANLTAVLETCGRHPGDVAKLTVWVARAEDAGEVLDTLDALLSEHAPGDRPVLTTLVAPLPVPGAAVQLEAVATSSAWRAVSAPDVPDRTPDGRPVTQAVTVPLRSTAGSWLRRFTWPSHLTDDELALTGQREVAQDLGHLVLLAGLVGCTPDGALADGMSEQARQVFRSMHALTRAAGGAFADLVQFDVYYADRALYPSYNLERIDYLEAHVPDKAWFAGSGPQARSTVPGALLVLESIAVVA